MKVTFEVTGISCDLALHPISTQTAKKIKEKGRDIYAEKYMNWWRKGNTRTFGMRLCDECAVALYIDDEQVAFDEQLLLRDVVTLRRRMYLNSKAKYLAVLGYDDETCTYQWTWNDIEDFDPARFQFRVLNWDRVLKTTGYNVLDDIFYDNLHADEDVWLNPSGFTLMDPIVIPLDEVRQIVEEEKRQAAAAE